MDETNEIIGFLARWSLLAVAAGLVVLTTALVVSAGMNISGESESATMVFSDVLWLRSEPVYISSRGIVTPPVDPENEAIICYRDGGDPSVSIMSEAGAVIQVGKVSEGSHTVSVLGLPYSRRTFATAELALAASGDRPVILIGVKWLLSNWRTKLGQADVSDIIDQFRGSATIVWLLSGEAEDFLQQRQWSREICEEAIVVYLGPEESITWDALRVFHRQSGLRDATVPVDLLAFEGPLAMMAARLGIRSHWISSTEPTEPLPKNVRRYSALRKFKESRHEAPISH